MKSNTLAVVLILGISLPLGAVAAPPQDLQHINDLVNQARELADSARAAATTPANQTTPTSQFKNPFSQNAASVPNPGSSAAPNPSTLVASDADGTNVAVDNQEIRVNAGGRQFTIPRIPNQATAHTVASGLASPPADVRNTVDRAMSLANNYRSFAEAVRAFRNADFAQATVLLEQAKTVEPQPFYDPFHSLCLFATGDFRGSAASAYSAAARSQVWSWDTLQGYYGNPDLYKQQYLQLQNAAQEPSADASVHFLLGYHHLMLGHRDYATREFEQVLGQLPNDAVVSNLLQVARQAPPLPGQ